MIERITEETEARMVARIFRVHWATVCERLEVSGQAACKFGVVEPIIKNQNSKPGDIDVLLGDRSAPEKAIAIECKRIKITAVSPGSDTVNKLSGIETGRAQAEALCKMGFYKTYLALLLQADVLERYDGGSLFKFPLPETLAEVQKCLRSCQLCSHGGILCIENTQPAEESYENLGGLSVEIIRKPIPHDQSTELTALVAAALK